MIVGITHQAGEVFLPEFALHAAADGAGAECEPRDFYARLAERDPIGGACRWARPGTPPMPPNTVAAKPAFKKSRLE